MPWQVKVSRLPPGVTPEAFRMQLQQRLDAVNSALSTYQDTTALMRLNRQPVGQPFQADPILWQSVTTAMRVSEASGGVYDITVGPLVNLWGFGPEAVPERIPGQAEIDKARQQVGWRFLEMDADKHTLTRRRDIRLDLSSIGEGAGVDALAVELEKAGISDYMISVAGTLRVCGRKPDGENWTIAIERPDASGSPLQLLKLEGCAAVSTSGAYRNYHEIDGVRYSHTIDPRTGRPITHKGVSVSVVLPRGSASLADAWATALNALGPDEGYPLAVKSGIPAYYIEKGEKGFLSRFTPAFRPFLGATAP
ncbi:MAG TPA: FAD:protein FMN transferase [Fluviicoccus sp.]|nr:FAD:protein FMN transferase [Fluviicoccus sp.]